MDAPLIPAGLTICQLSPADTALAKACREFCLRMIKLTYGYDYTPEWHVDLDSLLQGEASHYSAANRGAFFVVRDEGGNVVGTCGMRGLRWKPNMVEQFKDRYGDAENVGSNWRMYVDPAWRKQGLGSVLIALRQQAAAKYGYHTLYIHCDINAARLRAYWETQGFRLIGTDEDIAHYDKPLKAA